MAPWWLRTRFSPTDALEAPIFVLAQTPRRGEDTRQIEIALRGPVSGCFSASRMKMPFGALPRGGGSAIDHIGRVAAISLSVVVSCVPD